MIRPRSKPPVSNDPTPFHTALRIRFLLACGCLAYFVLSALLSMAFQGHASPLTKHDLPRPLFTPASNLNYSGTKNSRLPGSFFVDTNLSAIRSTITSGYATSAKVVATLHRATCTTLRTAFICARIRVHIIAVVIREWFVGLGAKLIPATSWTAPLQHTPGFTTLASDRWTFLKNRMSYDKHTVKAVTHLYTRLPGSRAATAFLRTYMWPSASPISLDPPTSTPTIKTAPPTPLSRVFASRGKPNEGGMASMGANDPPSGPCGGQAKCDAAASVHNERKEDEEVYVLDDYHGLDLSAWHRAASRVVHTLGRLVKRQRNKDLARSTDDTRASQKANVQKDNAAAVATDEEQGCRINGSAKPDAVTTAANKKESRANADTQHRGHSNHKAVTHLTTRLPDSRAAIDFLRSYIWPSASPISLDAPTSSLTIKAAPQTPKSRVFASRGKPNEVGVASSGSCGAYARSDTAASVHNERKESEEVYVLDDYHGLDLSAWDRAASRVVNTLGRLLKAQKNKDFATSRDNTRASQKANVQKKVDDAAMATDEEQDRRMDGLAKPDGVTTAASKKKLRANADTQRSGHDNHKQNSRGTTTLPPLVVMFLEACAIYPKLPLIFVNIIGFFLVSVFWLYLTTIDTHRGSSGGQRIPLKPEFVCSYCGCDCYENKRTATNTAINAKGTVDRAALLAAYGQNSTRPRRPANLHLLLTHSGQKKTTPRNKIVRSSRPATAGPHDSASHITSPTDSVSRRSDKPVRFSEEEPAATRQGA